MPRRNSNATTARTRPRHNKGQSATLRLKYTTQQVVVLTKPDHNGYVVVDTGNDTALVHSSRLTARR